MVSSNMALLLVLFAACMCAVSQAEVSSDLASVVDLELPPGADWDYSDGPYGPANWGLQCNSGDKQSPIDVNLKWIHLDGTLDVPSKIYYHDAPAFVYGNGNVLEAEWAAGVYNCHDYDYILEKLVFHAPSEHTYSTKRFPLEVQFYHTHRTEGVAINSIVFKEGEHNHWLEQFLPALPTKQSLGKKINAGMVSSSGVGIRDLDWTRYYRYLGSLTTPPCTERPSVVWSLLKAPLTASKEQIQKIEDALLNKPNVRPIPEMQPRTIYYPRGVDDSN